nr:DUF3237 domain-containing protein [uncultured Rhodoferax sp.]
MLQHVPQPMPGLVLRPAYEALVTLQPEEDLGISCQGQRLRVPITGGHFHGPGLAGRILPGGADWQLLRSDGRLQIEAIYDMQTDDGAFIHVRNKGLWYSPNGQWPAEYAVTHPVFEAPPGPYEWMNTSLFVGTVGEGPNGPLSIRLAIYQVCMDPHMPSFTTLNP